MTRLDQFLAWAEANRLVMSVWATLLIFGTAALDWALPHTSVGFLYLIPILLSAPALNGRQIGRPVPGGDGRIRDEPALASPWCHGPAETFHSTRKIHCWTKTLRAIVNTYQMPDLRPGNRGIGVSVAVGHDQATWDWNGGTDRNQDA